MDTILVEVEGGSLRQVTVARPIRVMLYDRDSEGYKPEEFVDVVVDAHRLRSLTGGVEVCVIDPRTILDWPVHDGTVRGALVNHTRQRAIVDGLIEQSDESGYITVEFEAGQYHCYLEFEK